MSCRKPPRRATRRRAAICTACVERVTPTLKTPPCDATHGVPVLAKARRDSTLDGALIQSVSMRDFFPDRESSHDDFFASFGKFSAAPQPGRAVTIGYLAQVIRTFSREQIFAQSVPAFELARGDPRVVGLDLAAFETLRRDAP